MPDVHANFFRFAAGQFVEHEGRKFKIGALISVDSVLAEDSEDGTSHRLKIEAIKPWDSQKLPGPAEVPGRKDLSQFTEQEWAHAQRRLEAIKPLLALPVRTRSQVEQRARETGVNTATLYEWMKLFQATGHVSALVPERRGRKLGSRYLKHEQETLIKSVIEDKYLHKQRVKVQDVVDEVVRRARLAKQPVPSANTVRNRVAEIDPAEALKKRGRPDQARNLYDPIRGSFPGADFPLAVVQIDHTEVDIILVDEEHRKPLGRPWLTLAIDVYSRMVVGLYLTFEKPSATSTGMCVSRALCPKADYLASLAVGGEWPVWGPMDTLHCDNGKDLRGEVLQRGCDEYRINLEFRPAARPHFGGHIERMMGTIANEIRKLPGTTFSNIAQRKGYDSEGEAVLTLAEFERLLVDFIVNVYHQRVHKGIHMPPIRKWATAIVGTPDSPGRGILPFPNDPFRVQLDFMPFEYRTVQAYGIQWDNIRYYDPVLDRYINAADTEGPNGKKLFLVRRDPRDISRLYFLDPQDNVYVPIAYRDLSRPPISVWELNEVLKRLKDEGKDSVDEYVIFQAVERQRETVQRAKAKTKAARKQATRVPKPVPAPDRKAQVGSTAPREGGPPDAAATDAIDGTASQPIAGFPQELRGIKIEPYSDYA